MYQLEVEKLGVPTVTIVTSDFVGLAQSTMGGYGAADMPLVVVPHPLGGIPPSEVIQKVDAAFPKVVDAAIRWKPARQLPALKSAYPAARLRLTGTMSDVNDVFFKNGWSLGLPIVPPTVDAVAEILKGTARRPDEVLWEVPPRMGVLTVELVATYAAMAGLKAEHMPLLLALVDAMKDTQFDWRSQTTTTNPTFPLVIINGPIVDELGIASDQGAAGGGQYPNVNIGYFVNLIGDVIGGSKAPSPDKSTLGQAGNTVAMVVGENEKAIPEWKPLHVEMGFPHDTSTVSVVGVEGFSNMNIAAPTTARGVLEVMAMEMETIGPNNAVLHRGPAGVDAVMLLCPQNAEMLTREGLTKKDVRQYLYEHARIPYEKWKVNVRTMYDKDPWYTQWKPGSEVPVLESPDDVIVVVTGGAGTHSVYLPGFLTGEFAIREVKP